MTVPDYPPVAGWYRDPAGMLRWWDGRQWTASTRRGSIQERLNRNLRLPSWAALPVAAAKGAGWLVAFSIAVAALVRHRPLPGAGLLLLVAIPILVIGQVCAISAVAATLPPTDRARPPFRVLRPRRRGSSRALFFGSLPPAVGHAFGALAVAGWLLAMTVWIGIDHASRAPATAGCPYRLSNHGSYACVTEARYESAGAGVQRFAAGILSGFFALQCGSALNTVALRRQRKDQALFT